MILEAYRITKTRYANTAFSGEGTRLAGGRWNPIGTRMVYLASSLSLATLELFVHTEDYSILRKQFSYLTASFDSSLVETPDPKDLPKYWNSPDIVIGSQLFGDTWLHSQRSLILAVPSVVTPNELNYLINPEHPDFSRLKISEPRSFLPDPRLTRPSP